MNERIDSSTNFPNLHGVRWPSQRWNTVSHDPDFTAATPFGAFRSQQERSWPPLRRQSAGWPLEQRTKKFKDHKMAASRIWARIEGLGEAATPEGETEKPKPG
ncbi:MAG: hypothetical protein ABSH32_26485 [Bryobacteraceae bacterium]|jgi:hypothetical protein